MKKAKTKRKEQNQPSPGILNAEQIGRFKTRSEDITDLPIEPIKQVPLIPDFKDPTEATYPVIVFTPKGYHCIDGWNMIVQAKATEKSTIRCHVFVIDDHSDIELAIWKVSIRSKPEGGIGSYAERIRNALLLFNLIMQDAENPLIYSHGGNRRASFADNRQDDVIGILAERLGKSRTTINKYINFGEYLDDGTLALFVDSDMGKEFFEKVQINKRILIKNLISDGAEPAAITEEVSRKMMEWHREYQETNKITPDLDEPGSLEETEDQEDDPTEQTLPGNNRANREQEKVFTHYTPSADSQAPELPTEEQVKSKVKAVVDALSMILALTPFDCGLGVEIVDEQILQLVHVRGMLITILAQDNKNEGEV